MPKARRGVRTREPEEILRDSRAVELRRRHLTYEQIATELGMASKSSAYEAVQRGLADSIIEANDEVRQMEADRIDELARRALRVIASRHYKVHGGELIKHPETDEYLIDDMPILKGIETMVRLMERKAKLLGLDAPAQIEMITIGAVESEIARLTAELGRRDAESVDQE